MKCNNKPNESETKQTVPNGDTEVASKVVSNERQWNDRLEEIAMALSGELPLKNPYEQGTIEHGIYQLRSDLHEICEALDCSLPHDDWHPSHAVQDLQRQLETAQKREVVLRNALEDCERELRFNPVRQARSKQWAAAIERSQAALSD